MTHSRGLLIIAALGCIGLYAFTYRAVYSHDEAAAAGGPTRDPARESARAIAAPEIVAPPALAPVRHASSGRLEIASDPAPPDPRTDSAARAEQARAHRDYMAGVDAAYRDEPVDPRWSATTTATVQAAIAANALGPAVRDVACRARTCRIALADESPGAFAKALPLLIHRLGGELPTVAADRLVDAGGSASVVLYLSRSDPASQAR